MTRYKERRTDTPSAGQFFGYLLALSTVATVAYLLWLDWPLVAAFLAARPLLVLSACISLLAIFGAVVVWTVVTDRPAGDIYSAQDTRRPWEE